MLAIIFRKCRGGRALTFRFNSDIVTVKQKWQLVLNGDIVTLSKARDIRSPQTTVYSEYGNYDLIFIYFFYTNMVFVPCTATGIGTGMCYPIC
jgi:hypothetical protein